MDLPHRLRQLERSLAKQRHLHSYSTWSTMQGCFRRAVRTSGSGQGGSRGQAREVSGPVETFVGPLDLVVISAERSARSKRKRVNCCRRGELGEGDGLTAAAHAHGSP